jgi:integral membrane protein
MLRNPVTRLRFVSLAEATTFLLLLFASVVKHTGGSELGVQVLGPIHGLLFIAYVVFTLEVRRLLAWNVKTTVALLVASVIPFAPYATERWLADQQRQAVTL